MLQPSTFSIVAFDPGENALGIAVASKFLAVGAIVPWARSGAGAIATQSYANTTYGRHGLDLMESGMPAADALQSLIATDEEAAQRQAGFVDNSGGSATFTGSACSPWAGGVHGPGYAIQGNILTGPEVVAAMQAAYLSSNRPFYWRMYEALRAGDQAGGDKRGRQSAAILVVKAGAGYAGFNDRWIDYRVDDHPDPVTHLGDLLRLHDLYFDKSPLEEQIILQGDSLVRMQGLLTRLGDYRGPMHGEYDEPTRQALRAFIGRENFEDRVDFATGRIDLPVLDHLYSHFADIS